MKMLHNMTIPDGLTCSDCHLFNRCKAFISVDEKSTECDFYPIKFSVSPSKYAALQTALQAANEDAGQLSSEYAFYEEGTGWRCIHCGESHKHSGWKIIHAADCPITLHRARVGGE